MKIDDYREILRKYWGYDDFRGIQREIIESVGSGHDTLGLMPTGGGKSITFQVPALASKGVCLVITPLIALMKDQVANLKRHGIRAAAIYSGMTYDSIATILDNAVFGAVKFLYVSPERLASELFQKKLSHTNVCLVTVDEAHCISQWGHDFRPSYLKIAAIRSIVPDAPVLALTATATPSVVDDIQDCLGFKEKRVFRMSFERKNLAYVVRTVDDKRGEMVHVLRSVEGSAIVYTRSRQRTKEVAELLSSEGIEATSFHAGLENAVKDARQKSWQTGKTRVMVATNAFGMGIDKPDVRVVIHIDCPDSIESYFQEAGRAGRDGKKAYSVLLYNKSDDRKLHKRINDNFPPKDYIKDVYEHLAYFFQIAVGAGYNMSFEFDIDRFCRVYKFFPIQVSSALRILDRAGYIEYNETPDGSDRVMFTLRRDDLYRLRNNAPEEDKVVVALLRNYSGLFCDYSNIDKSHIAMLTGMDVEKVYEVLKSLSQKRILSFIPRKNTPMIRYAQRREDTKDIILPKQVYDDRKDDYAVRINAMLYYAQSDSECRSQLLLRYFGEDNAKRCKQCDVCLSHKETPKLKAEEARERIMTLLSDGRKHHVKELRCLLLPTDILNEALSFLMSEEYIYQTDGFLYCDGH